MYTNTILAGLLIAIILIQMYEIWRAHDLIKRLDIQLEQHIVNQDEDMTLVEAAFKDLNVNLGDYEIYHKEARRHNDIDPDVPAEQGV